MVEEPGWSNAEINRFVRTIQPFENLAAGGLQSLLMKAVLRRFPAGATFFQQGDAPRWFYLILEGAVKTFRNSDNGNEATLRLLQSGDVLTENMMFPNIPSPVYAQTTEESLLMMIPVEIIKEHARRDNQFLDNIMAVMACCYRDAARQVDGLILKNPTERVGHYLLKQYIEKRDTSSSDSLIPHNKSAIASHLGMAPETFSRTLGHLKSKGINFQGRKIQLLDEFSLCKYCDLDLAGQCKNYADGVCPVFCDDIKEGIKKT